MLSLPGSLLPPLASAQEQTFASTADFDSGTKNQPGDGNYGVETRTDNPGIAPDLLELGSLKGDSFTLDDSNADTFKWGVPGTCTVRSPTTIIRQISGGALHLGANRASSTTRVGVVSSYSISGDIDVRIKVTEVTAQSNSLVSLLVLNERRCYYESNPRTADGIEYEWDEGTLDGSFALRAYTIANGSATLRGAATTLSLDPIFLRIVRSASSWSWYYSADGTSWILDERYTFAFPGGLYSAFMIKDQKGGATTEFALDDYQVATGTVAAGGFRTSGDWISPSFDVMGGKTIDRVSITGAFDALHLLDRTEIRRSAAVVEAFEEDNLLVATPSKVICGTDISLRLYLKGDGLDTPGVTRIDVFYRDLPYPTNEIITAGTSTGTGNQCAADDFRDVKTETLGGVATTIFVDGETIMTGSVVAGVNPPSPSDVDSSDNVAVQYQEGAILSHLDTGPASQTLGTGELDLGTFPSCLNADDGDACAWSEGATTVEESFYPGTETITTGSAVSGTFPTGIEGNDDASIQYEEGDTGTSVQDFFPSLQTILKGSEGSDPTYKQGTFVRKIDGTGLQSITGIGFEGRALLLWWTRQPSAGTKAGNYAGIGLVASPAQQYCVAWGDDDNLSPSNSGRRSAAKAIVILRDGTPTVDGEASFAGFTSDGWTLDWTTNPTPAQGTIIHYIVFGGSVTNAYVGQFTGPTAGVTGNRAYTGVGFQGNLAIFLGSLQTGLGNSSHATMGFGAATGPSNRGAVSIEIPDGTTTADTEVVQDNRRALIMYNPALAEPTTDQLMDFVSFNPDGFTLNHVKTTSGSVLFWAMVLRGGTYKVDYLTRPPATGDQHVTGLGFHPEGVLFWGGSSTISFGSEDAGAEFDLGAGSQTESGVAEGAIWVGSNDAVNPTNANMHTSDTKVMKDLSLSSQANQNEADYKSSDGDGFTITWTTVQSSSTQKWLWLAIGGESQAPSFPTCVQGSDGSSCTYREADPGGTGTFEVEVKHSWSNIPTSGLEWRLYVEGRQGSTNPETIEMRIYGSDEVALSDTRCSLLSATDAVYDCGTLTTDQLDAGSPDVLFADEVRLADGAPSTFALDEVYIRRAAALKGLEVRYDWSGLPAGGTSYELRVEGRVQDEPVGVQVLTPPSTWTTRLTLSSTVETDQSYVLTPEEFNLGSPSVRFVDSVPTDEAASSVWLDHVRVVRANTAYTLALEWDWTGSIEPSGPTLLVVHASRTGGPENVLAEVWDWQDLLWRSAFTVDAASETEYSTPLASACTDSASDCEISTPSPGSVRIRFTDVDGPDVLETTLSVDVGVVRSVTLANALEIRYDWSSIGDRSGEDALVLEARRGDEDVLVQVWDWGASAWSTRVTIASAEDETLTHVLTTAEISAASEVRIRFIGASDVIDDLPSDVWLDYVAIEKREYRLDIENRLSGISGAGPFALHIQGSLGATGENFDVWVWDWVASAWTLWLDSPFATQDQTFERSLLASELQDGEVRVRYTDDVVVGDSTPNALLIDLLEVAAS